VLSKDHLARRRIDHPNLALVLDTQALGCHFDRTPAELSSCFAQSAQPKQKLGAHRLGAWCIKGLFGAGKEARTLDLYLGKVSLYQLSYSRMGDHGGDQRKTHRGDGLINLVAWGGIEPPTQGFSIDYTGVSACSLSS
jgi:hypothetical protein